MIWISEELNADGADATLQRFGSVLQVIKQEEGVAGVNQVGTTAIEDDLDDIDFENEEEADEKVKNKGKNAEET